MARHFGWAFAAFLIFGSVQAAATQRTVQPEKQNPRADQQKDSRKDHDRGLWWRQGHPVARELSLSTEQSDKIERIWAKHSEKSVPMRKELDTLEKALDETIRGQKLDEAAFVQEVERIENKRAELNKRRLVMFYRFRLVLTAEQNNKFQAMVDRRDAERRRQDGDRRR
jgi:Spy/CpxP family protein refolding chaperone